MLRDVREICVVAVCLLSVLGCANTPPTHFYLLGAMPPSSASINLEPQGLSTSLGLGPIHFPKYLDRPQIVTKMTAHEIELAEFHKWAEPLKDNVTHVLKENLSVLLGIDRIVSYPWTRSNLPEYQVSLDIIQLDRTIQDEAVLKVRWTLIRGNGTDVLKNKTSHYSEVLHGSDYEGLVAAMSRMFATFSQDIADAIHARSSVGSENS